jgi:hypothetical protein
MLEEYAQRKANPSAYNKPKVKKQRVVKQVSKQPSYVANSLNILGQGAKASNKEALLEHMF